MENLKEYDKGEMGDPDIKLIIIGDTACGKSKLVERYLLDDYEQRQMSTYALTMYRKQLEINKKKYEVDIWDTAGQEQYSSLHPSYYFGAHVCLLVFDLKRKESYKNLGMWYEEMRKMCKDIPCILVANKIDARPDMAKRKFGFATKHNLPFYFTSAADGTNVVKIFREALSMGIKFKEDPNSNFVNDVIDILNDDDFDFD